MAEKVRIPNNNDGEIDHKQLGELTQFFSIHPDELLECTPNS